MFRFYDIDNAEGTTTTGQKLIQFTEKIANSYYNKILKTDKEEPTSRTKNTIAKNTAQQKTKEKQHKIITNQ